MEGDWSGIVLRFAVYLDLMVLFGVPLFALQVPGARARGSWVGRRYLRLAAAGCVLGAVFSWLGLVAMAREMVGASDSSEVSRHVLRWS